MEAILIHYSMDDFHNTQVQQFSIFRQNFAKIGTVLQQVVYCTSERNFVTPSFAEAEN